MTAAMPTGRVGQALAIALVALVLLAAWLAVAAPLLDLHAERAAALDGRAALARRMAQVATGLPELRQAAAAAAGPVAPTLIEGASDAVAGAVLLQGMQDMAGRAGATLSSTETLPVEAAGAYRRIGVRVALSAPWPVLVALLRAVADASPQLLVDDLQLHGARQFGTAGEPPIDASFVAFGFRAP